MAFVLRRNAARVICFDPHGRVLLIRSSDPADRAKPSWWELPGGGIDAGEMPEEACLRELREEVGMATAVMGRCVWTQRAQFTFAGWDFDQNEQIHIAHSDGTTELPTHLEAFEAMAFEGHRWWTIDDLMTSDEPTVPPRLREFLPDVVSAMATGTFPDQPVDISPL